MSNHTVKIWNDVTSDQARYCVRETVRCLLFSLMAVSFHLFGGTTNRAIVYKCTFTDGTVKYTNRTCPAGATGSELFTYSAKSLSEKAKDTTARPAIEINPEHLRDVEEQALSYLRNHCRFQLNSYNASLLGGYARFYAERPDLSTSEAVAHAAIAALGDTTLEPVEDCD